ncbi:PAS domain-containing protein [Actinomadura sp. NPDC048394]|uniref:PAS domain-containing protein n=1 Tax=Actinomadura sp. NPDC048394 TaxID=3158223 RepID=UPI0033D7B9A5
MSPLSGSAGNGRLRALHPDDREATKWAQDAVRREGRPCWYMYRLPTAEGEYRHFEVRTAPIYQNGGLIKWIGAHIDIEQRLNTTAIRSCPGVWRLLPGS